MAATGGRQREGKPFFLALVCLAIGTVWTSAGGNIDAFGHLGSTVAEHSGELIENPAQFFERLIRLPQPVKFPPQRIIPPKQIAAAKAANEKSPEPRSALPLLGGEGRPNPFFPKWAVELARQAQPPIVDVAGPGVGPGGPGAGIADPNAPRVETDQYVFNGIVKIKDDPPVAVLRDMQKQVSVFLKEGERYGPIQAVKVGVEGATFVISGRDQMAFDTLHGSNKTITVRRATGGS